MDVSCTARGPTPRSILDLPAELLDSVFCLLAIADLKQLRRTCKGFLPFTKNLHLRSIPFTFSTDGVQGLARAVEGKSQFVRTLKHVPIPIWPECPDYDVFCWNFSDPKRDGNYADGIVENDPKALETYEQEQEQQNSDPKDLETYEQEQEQQDSDREDLFDEYRAEYEEAKRKIQSLASDLYFLERGHQYKQSPLQLFDEMIESLEGLREFVQKQWSQDIDRSWRHLYLEDCSDEDEDAGALHLCLILRSLGLANLQLLKYMKFSVRGPAFWTANRLGWLLSNGDHRELRETRAGSDDSVVDIESGIAAGEEEGNDSGVIAQERRTFAEVLDMIFNSTRHVRYLDCTVSDDDFQDSLLSIAEPLSKLLGRASDLRRLRLTFGILTNDYPPPEFHCIDGTVKLLTLLTNNRPWPNLRRLKLAIVVEEQTLLEFLYSISQTLTRLTLKCVTLAPGKGTWKSTLVKMASMLPAVQLKLHFLYEYPPDKGLDDKGSVQVLYPEAAVWKRGDTSYSQQSQYGST